jgi:hypothetical protein
MSMKFDQNAVTQPCQGEALKLDGSDLMFRRVIFLKKRPTIIAPLIIKDCHHSCSPTYIMTEIYPPKTRIPFQGLSSRCI